MESKPNPFLRSASLAASIVFCFASSAHAGTQYWSGAGTWNTGLNWGAASGGPYNAAWTNGTADIAVFEGTGGLVTIGANRNADRLDFNVTGYTLNAASLVTLTGAGGTNYNLAANVTATIGANVTLQSSSTSQNWNIKGTNKTTSILELNGVIKNNTANTSSLLDATVNVNTGGQLIALTSIVTGTATSGSGSILNVAGGTVSIANASSSLILNNTGGITADSSITVSNGGSIIFTDAGNTNGIRFGAGSTNALTQQSGTLNLDGGVVTVNKIFMGGSYTGGSVYNATVNFNGGTLRALKTNNADFLTGIIGTGAIVKSGGTVIDSNTFDITIGQALLHDSTLGATLDGGLVKKSAGTLTLTGNNTYTGATNVKDGTVVLSGGDNRLASAGSVVLGDTSTSGKLVLGDTSAASNQILASLTTTGNGGSVVGGNASSDSVLTLSFASGTVTYSGSLGGAGTNENKLALTKTGAGVFLLDGTNTYTGATTVNAGELRIGSANALDGTSGITVTATGAGLSLSGGVSVGSGKTITINGTGIGSFNAYGALTNNGGDNTWAGNVTIGSTGARIGSLSGNLTVTGIIDSGIATTGLVIRLTNSTTNLTLNNENTYLGDTTFVTGGGSVILSGGNNRLPTGTKLIFGSSNVSGLLDLNGQDQEVAGISVAQTSGTYTNEIKSTAAATLTVNTAAASSFSGTITGAIGLSKSGSDTLTLSAANTYTGDTTIKAGTLALGASGSIANSTKLIVGDAVSSSAVLDVSAKTSGFSIGGTQTLSGIGTVDANTSATLGGGDGTKYTVTMANGAIHAVGNATEDAGIGSQTIDGNLTYSAGSIFEWDLNGNTADSGDRGIAGGYDGVDGTGALVVDDTENTGTIFRIVLGTGVDFEDAFWTTPNAIQTWSDIFSGFTGLTGGFHTSNIDIVGAPENLATIGSFTISGTSLTWSAVPEPSSALVGLLIGAGLLRRRRVA